MNKLKKITCFIPIILENSNSAIILTLTKSFRRQLQKLQNKTIDISPSTVEEKIHLEKQLPFNPGHKIGPTTNLYFHELTSEKNTSQKVLRITIGLVLSALFVVTFPLFALLIKGVSSKSLVQKIEVPGRRGRIFTLYRYPVDSSIMGSFLKKTGLYKLPSVINLWKGNINLIGPQPYPKELCNKWNKELSDYYKRFSLKPGFWGVAEPISDYENLEEVAQSLDKELRYILNPSLKKDVRCLFGIY